MKEMVREIISDYLTQAALKQAIESYVIDRMDGIDMDELAEAVLDDIDIFDEAVLVAAEMLLPF
jgi:hypothetical protein